MAVVEALFDLIAGLAYDTAYKQFARDIGGVDITHITAEDGMVANLCTDDTTCKLALVALQTDRRIIIAALNGAIGIAAYTAGIGGSRLLDASCDLASGDTNRVFGIADNTAIGVCAVLDHTLEGAVGHLGRSVRVGYDAACIVGTTSDITIFDMQIADATVLEVAKQTGIITVARCDTHAADAVALTIEMAFETVVPKHTIFADRYPLFGA